MKLYLGGAEIDEHAMFESGGSEVAQNLRGMFIGKRADGFELNNEFTVDHEVGSELTQDASVFVPDTKRNLLLNLERLIVQAVSKRIFIDLFVVAVAQESMRFEGGLSDDVG